MRLNGLFQDGAVLQRDSVIPVWGREARPGARITAELAGKTVYSKVRPDGRFLLRLPPLPAGGPWVLTVSTPADGDSVTVRDILVGELWLASGQSNMEYEIGSEWAPLRPPRTRAEVQQVGRAQQKDFLEKVSGLDHFRYFKVEKCASGLPEDDISGQWCEVSGSAALNISAVAGWFGLKLRQNLGIPVGILVSAWSGSIVEAWTSRAGLKNNPDTTEMVSRLDELYSKAESWPADGSLACDITSVFRRCSRTDPGNTGVSRGWANPGFDDSGWLDIEIPGSWIGQHLAGSGAVWIRREITIPEDWAGLDLVLETGGIDKHDITYFNGVEIGRTGCGFETGYCEQCRRYRIPARNVHSGRNILAIRAFSFLYDGAFGGSPEAWRISTPNPADRPIPLAGKWKFHCEFDWGIIRVTEKDKIRPWGPGNPNTPGILFDSMIRPLIPMAFRGVIWYQGESNAHSGEDAGSYAGKLSALIHDWRFRWGQGNFPFIQTQLPEYTVPNAESAQLLWAVLREQQAEVCRLPAVYMIPTLGLGDKKDIHPQNKRPIGIRLAELALHRIYGFGSICGNGPEPSSWSVDNSTVKLFFRHADGLYLKGTDFGCFCLAGPDNVFYEADEAAVSDNMLLLRSHRVAAPCQVRYAWKNDPDPVLFNAADWPAGPFRIDLTAASKRNNGSCFAGCPEQKDCQRITR